MSKAKKKSVQVLNDSESDEFESDQIDNDDDSLDSISVKDPINKKGKKPKSNGGKNDKAKSKKDAGGNTDS